MEHLAWLAAYHNQKMNVYNNIPWSAELKLIQEKRSNITLFNSPPWLELFYELFAN